jgi:uncharacterized membrane protein SirB2
MAKFGKTGQRILKIIHLFFASVWIGGAVALYLMLSFLGPGKTQWEFYGYSLAMKMVDDMVIIPGAIGTLLSGILISCFTHWGFFKHTWVVLKLILTVLCILAGTFVLGPAVNGQPGIIAELGLMAEGNGQFQDNRSVSFIGGAIQILMIVFMMAISTLKPFNRNPTPKAAAGGPAGSPGPG